LKATTKMTISSAIEKNMKFTVRCFYSLEACIERNKAAANLFVYSQETDYPAFPGERQGCVKRSRKGIIILSRLFR
jgi:hypothetical protein